MSRNNIFGGESTESRCAKAVYKVLMSGKWISYQDVLCEVDGSFKIGDKLSNSQYYTALKKAFSNVHKQIENTVGKDSIEEKGKTRNKLFHYKGTDTSPLEGLLLSNIRKNVEDYWKFCQDTAGFLPMEWLEYFFRGTTDLLDIKKKKQTGNLKIDTSSRPSLRNMELIPRLYEAIDKKEVLAITYKPYKKPEAETIIVHPHLLKEYNGRWFLFCHHEMINGYNIALDRIECEPEIKQGIRYINAPNDFYSTYFSNLIGVTHKKGSETQKVVLRIYDEKVFGLIKTKLFHNSQKVEKEYGGQNGGEEYGEISLYVELNKELFANILYYGSDIEVVAPKKARQKMYERVRELTKRYNVKLDND